MTKNSIFKDFLIFISIFVLILVTSPFTASAQAGGTDITSHLDAILVTDISGSMSASDRNRISIEGVKLFIDMLEQSGSRVAVIGFNGDIAFETELTPINTDQDKIDILDKISVEDDNRLAYGGSTDIGMALKKAESIINKRTDKANKPLIILFTDGKIETSTNSDRTAEQSRDEVDQVILGAKSRYKIYTIGLNANNSVDEELLNNISGETNAKPPYITKNASELRGIFTEIFADYISSDVIPVEIINGHADINIPNSSVVEANITLFSDFRNSSIKVRLTDPSGVEVPLGGSNNVYYSVQNYYAFIKMISPERGVWSLDVEGVNDENIEASLVYSYDLGLTASFVNSNVKKGDTVTIIGSLLGRDGGVINDAELIAAFNAELQICDENDSVLGTIKMNTQNDGFSADYILTLTEGKYTFLIKASGSGFYRESEPISLEIKNIPPESTNQLQDSYIYYIPFIKNSLDIELFDYFNDIDDPAQSITFRADFEGEDITADITNSNLTIKANGFFRFCKSEVSITCEDPSKASVTGTFLVHTIPIMFFVFLVVLLIASAVFAPIFAKRLKGVIKPAVLVGSLKYVIINGGIYGDIKRERLAAYKGKVRLTDIIEDEELQGIPEFNKIIFTQGGVQPNGSLALEVENGSSFDAYEMAPLEKKFLLKHNSPVTIKKKGESISIRLTYTT